MSVGLLMVTFGEVFDKLAAESFRHSRKFTELPLHVLTNVEKRSSAWDGIPNVTFKYFNMAQNENRKIKLTMNKYSPFDETLYLDCDSVIQRGGVENFVTFFLDKNVVLSYNKTFKENKPLFKLYAITMRKFEVPLPLPVYYGAIIAFRKTDDTNRFFECWYKLWTKIGTEREMPSLCCVVKKYNLPIALFPHHWFSGTKKVGDAVVQHDYGDSFCKKFNISRWVCHKEKWYSKKVRL
jgi:hypothetical protein